VSRLLAHQALSSFNPASRIGILAEGGGAWKAFDRYLTVDGQKAYHIGNLCDTCEFFFERKPGAGKVVDTSAVAKRLQDGLTNLEDLAVASLTAGLPAGEYIALLLETTLFAAEAGSKTDYFAHDHFAAHNKLDETYGEPHNFNPENPPHDPKTDYYRVTNLPGEPPLFEFIAPAIGRERLADGLVAEYAQQSEAGRRPTAVALSILESKGAGHGLNDLYYLTHYLLDGHHKTAAAAQTGRPLTILSFLAMGRWVSWHGEPLPDDPRDLDFLLARLRR